VIIAGGSTRDHDDSRRLDLAAALSVDRLDLEAELAAGARGAGHIVGAASSRLIALYRSLGIDVAPIGVPRRYWGERRQLFMVDLERTGRTLRALP
jgi:hypothetical protein